MITHSPSGIRNSLGVTSLERKFKFLKSGTQQKSKVAAAKEGFRNSKLYSQEMSRSPDAGAPDCTVMSKEEIELRKKFKKYLMLVFRDLSLKHN